MKLYVIDQQRKTKTYLRTGAPTRRELSKALGSFFAIEGKLYSINDVRAEPSSDSTAIGGLLGGIIGAAGGAPGVVFGGLLGAAVGENQATREKKEAELFNGSSL